ncbi:iron ABC transporter permease [Parahaliea maris]|uniref:Iron ABC transporter permease n=1 Tax=Parahaliea maris TaxID=2716870 RepID=A0A5C9A4L5_9GAMM|nr:iron ABC transporter permease [Parahaliea maris]TXS95873.1 iron ABC transporter permease [Parahaliea maris]
MVIALASGAVTLSTGEALGGLAQWWRGEYSQAGVIVGQIRLPRVLLAALVGAILATSGAAMQGLFRNPLADPSLIGVTAGASLGASVVIVLVGASLQGITAVTAVSLGAFVGGLLAVLLVYRLAASEAGTSVATMLLAGIAITALAGALGNLLEFHADSESLRRISLWRMGGLDGANSQRLLFATAICLLVLGALPVFARRLNALLLGESEARYLGIDVEFTKRTLIVIVAIGVGACVALAGTIAFVGLVVPHIMRMLVGPDHRGLLPASALAGAALLVVADNLARVVMAPTELPVGIVTAIVGVPFFISLLRQRSHYGMQ